MTIALGRSEPGHGLRCATARQILRGLNGVVGGSEARRPWIARGFRHFDDVRSNVQLLIEVLSVWGPLADEAGTLA
jgi:hypothetical protein